MMEPFAFHEFLAYVVPGTVMIVLGYPIVRLVAKRLEPSARSPAGSTEMASRLERIEQTVDSIAIEVERISEAQRFTARLEAGRAGESGVLLPGTPPRS
ncbi:MAG: hypothetical protein M3068_01420 [Gemmatimonadota bacterium]|nr:hypothetical protein [Gemmatimonadota bacterium]